MTSDWHRRRWTSRPPTSSRQPDTRLGARFCRRSCELCGQLVALRRLRKATITRQRVETERGGRRESPFPPEGLACLGMTPRPVPALLEMVEKCQATHCPKMVCRNYNAMQGHIALQPLPLEGVKPDSNLIDWPSRWSGRPRSTIPTQRSSYQPTPSRRTFSFQRSDSMDIRFPLHLLHDSITSQVIKMLPCSLAHLENWSRHLNGQGSELLTGLHLTDVLVQHRHVFCRRALASVFLTGLHLGDVFVQACIVEASPYACLWQSGI